MYPLLQIYPSIFDEMPLLEGRQNRPIYSYGNSFAHKSRHHFKWVERVNFVKIYYLYCLEKSVTMGIMSWIA